MAISTVSIHVFGDVPSSPLVGVLQVCAVFLCPDGLMILNNAVKADGPSLVLTFLMLK